MIEPIFKPTSVPSNVETEEEKQQRIADDTNAKLAEDAKFQQEEETAKEVPVEERNFFTPHEEAGAKAIASANEQEEARITTAETADRELQNVFTAFEVEPDSAGVRVVVTKDNQLTFVVSMGVAVESIPSVVNAMRLLKTILTASRGDLQTNFVGLIRR